MRPPPLAGVVIRVANAADAPRLATFAANAFAAAFGDQNRPEDVAAHAAEVYAPAVMAAEMEDPRVTTLVAERAAAIVGYAQLRTGEPPACVLARDAIEIQRFYVDASLHGTGFASHLMTASLDAARTRGAPGVWLGVWERNPRAIAFYAKHGFTDVGSKVYVVGSDPQTDRVMVKGSL